MNQLIRLTFLFFLLVITVTCNKDEDVPGTDDPVDETIIKEETKTESISASTGGIIELESGVVLGIPSNALSSDKSITVETINPFLEENDNRIDEDLNGLKVSAIVRCQPDGTTFNVPIQIKIPYYEELLPDQLPIDSIQVISFSNDSIDFLPFTIDRAKKLIIAETTHFSDITIKIVDGDWIIDYVNLSKNEQTNSLKIGFSANRENIDIWDEMNDLADVWLFSYQRIYYNIRLYRKRTGTNEYLGGLTLGKAFFQNYNDYRSVRLIKGTEFDKTSTYDYNSLPEDDEDDIFQLDEQGSYGKPFAATLKVVFDEDKNIISGPTFTTINQSNINSNFVDKLNYNGSDFYVDLVDMSLLEEDEDYYIKIDIIGKGDIINETKNKYRGEITFGDFTLNDINTNQTITENSRPTISNIKPGNSTFKYKEDFTLSCSANDKEDGTLSGQSVWWNSDKYGILGYGSTLKSSDFNKELEIGTHRITVYAEDGVGSMDWEIFQITIENNAPEVKITSPSNSSNHDYLSSINFAGTITDVEDANNLITNNIIWISNKDGIIEAANGKINFSYNGLSAGTHSITLNYEDSNGELGNYNIQITINNEPPVVKINLPQNEYSFDQGSIVAFDGTATDPEGENIPESNYKWVSDKFGEFMTGKKKFNYSEFPVGTHKITLKVNDSQGAEGSATTTLIIKNVGKPSVSTLTTTEVTQTSAKFNGEVTNDGGAEVTERGFYWSDTNSNPDKNDHVVQAGDGTGKYNYSITGLEPNKPYFVKAYAKNSKGESTGGVDEFVTLGSTVTEPVVTTNDATNITTTGATLNGYVVFDGGSSISLRGFYWSTTNTNPDENDNVELVTGTTGEMSFELSGLQPDETIYYKAWAQNNEGLFGYGGPVSFTTKSENTGYIKLEYVMVNGGDFQMGDTTDNAKPIHSVSLSSFEICKYEITHTHFIEFLNSIKCNSDGTFHDSQYGNVTYIEMINSAVGNDGTAFYFKKSSRATSSECPVYNVTWFGANAFCKWVDGRLPTEAEWEYAARGGNMSNGYIYSGSNNIDNVGWYGGNSNSLHPVGTKEPNEIGIYDMTGNVWEWCSDWYDMNYYNMSPEYDPQGPEAGERRVLRGGCFYFAASNCTVTFRNDNEPSTGYYGNGFRVVKDSDN